MTTNTCTDLGTGTCDSVDPGTCDDIGTVRLAIGQVVEVPSRTTPGVVYHVVRTIGGVRCDCPAGRHDRACHHLAVVDAGVTPAPALPVAAVPLADPFAGLPGTLAAAARRRRAALRGGAR